MSHRIAGAAGRGGVPATTIRYDEDQGLLRPAARTANGCRTYDDRDVERRADPLHAVARPGAWAHRGRAAAARPSHGRGADDGGTSLRFPAEPAVAAEITALAAAEQDGCTFVAFDLRITADALHLEVTAPPEGQQIVAADVGPTREATGPRDDETKGCACC